MEIHSGEASADRRPLVVAALVLAVLTAALFPFGARPLGSTISFVPAVLAVVAGLDMMTVYLLVAEFRDSGDARLFALALAYIWSLTAMLAYALAFPGAISAHPPLALTPSMAPWFYLVWHVGFPVVIGLAWAPWPTGWEQFSRPARRTRICVAGITFVCAVAGGAVTLLALGAHRLPVLIHGVDTSRMTALTAPVALPLVALSAVLTLRGTRGRTGPERWSAVAVLACLCDLVLTYGAQHRFSVGWYAGRSMTVGAAGVVLVATLGSFRRLKARAERDATIDPLTGLANRRSGRRSLGQMTARSHRSGLPLGIVAFDIDDFKSINDRFGHEAGDLVLRIVGQHLRTAVRIGDEPMRTGGEEFLVLLPDTDAAGAVAVAEHLRQSIRGLNVPGLAVSVSVSLGAGCWGGLDETVDDLLVRVDQALYRAKAQGRNQTVLATLFRDLRPDPQRDHTAAVA